MMTPLPRPAVFGAAASLAGAALLGLYIGVHDSLMRPGEEPTAASGAATVALRPGMAAAIQAQPIKPDALAVSSAPAQLAQASAKPKASDQDQSDQDEQDASDSGDTASGRNPAEPPPLYSPDAPPAPPPPSQDNTPPF